MKLPSWVFFLEFCNLHILFATSPCFLCPSCNMYFVILSERKKSIICITDVRLQNVFSMIASKLLSCILHYLAILYEDSWYFRRKCCFQYYNKVKIFNKSFNNVHCNIPKLLLSTIIAMCLFFMPSNKIKNLLVNFFWSKLFMLLHFLEVPIACFSNYGNLFFCLKSVLSVDEMVSMLAAFFFLCLQCFWFVQQLIYMLASETGKTDLSCSFFLSFGKMLWKEFSLHFSFSFLVLVPSFLSLYLFYLLLLQLIWGDMWQLGILKDCSGSSSKNVKVLYNF